MVSLSELLKKFSDWCTRLGQDSIRYSKNPNTQHGHLTPSPNARKKAVRTVDRWLFGIGKKSA